MTVSIAELLKFHADKGTPDDYCPSVNLGELKNLVAERDILRGVALALADELEARPVITPGDPDPPAAEDYPRPLGASPGIRQGFERVPPGTPMRAHQIGDRIVMLADVPKGGPDTWFGIDPRALERFTLGEPVFAETIPFTPGIPMKKIAKRIALVLAAALVVGGVYGLIILLISEL